MAVGRKILIAAYHVLKDKVPYQEPVLHEHPGHRQKKIKNYLAKLKELGVELQVAS